MQSIGDARSKQHKIPVKFLSWIATMANSNALKNAVHDLLSGNIDYPSPRGNFHIDENMTD